MARLDHLLANYRRYVALPRQPHLPLSQRIWFLVYPPEDERRLTNRLTEFELATRDAGPVWQRLDLTGAVADWLDTFDDKGKATCLADPEIVEDYARPGFRDFLCARLQTGLTPTAEAGRTVFALTGLMELYDFIHVSEVIEASIVLFQACCWSSSRASARAIATAFWAPAPVGTISPFRFLPNPPYANTRIIPQRSAKLDAAERGRIE